MADILISKVMVKRIRSGFATYTDKRHHGISDYLFARKWGIGTDKANRNLQYTTQDNMRSNMNPLTRHNRKYFLLQRLSQLNCIFYTDTLFSKENP